MASNPEINSPARDPAWKQKANAFWRWWSGELAQLVPERFASLHGADRAPLLAVDAASAAIVDARPGAPEQRVDLAGLDEARRKAAVRGLLERAGGMKMRARAVLGPQEALVRRVTMPAATEENLRQVLAFEMDRLTPFRADEVYFGYRVLSRDAAAAQLLLQVAVARRELVDARVQALRALGVSVQGVGLRDEAGQGAAMDLLPSEQRGERESPRERLVQRGLAIAVVLLFAAALALPLLQKRSEWIALNPAVDAARTKAESTSALSQELERQAADYNFLLTRKHGNYSALEILEEVTHLLPDNTWVQQMDLRTVGKTREVQITGETASASKLIEILESSSVLRNAAFRGTVTRGSQPNTERFMIAAEVKPRNLPAARPALEVVAELPPPGPARNVPAPAPALPPPAPATVTVTPAGTPALGERPPVAAPAPAAAPASVAPASGPFAAPAPAAPAAKPKGPVTYTPQGVPVGPDGWPIGAAPPQPKGPPPPPSVKKSPR
jgi:general secretion pathway protein L